MEELLNLSKGMKFMEVQKTKLTAVIDSHVGDNGIPEESSDRKSIYLWSTSATLICHQNQVDIQTCIADK